MAAQIKHPLAVPINAGLDLIEKYNLRAESSLRDNIEEFPEYANVLYSAHAPTTIGRERLNIAAIDDEFRDLSLAIFKDYLDKCSLFPHVKQFNMHFALKRWIAETQARGQVGDYERHIESVRILAEHAAKYDIEIVLENINSYWELNGISVSTSLYEVNWPTMNEAFGMHPEEWIQICLDVDRQNVRLCLDTSHVCTYAHRFPSNDRESKINSFLVRPDLISHVHWSDNYLYDVRGRDDSHLPVGKGTLPVEFHRAVKYLDATILLEHYYTEADLAEELSFIDGL